MYVEVTNKILVNGDSSGEKVEFSGSSQQQPQQFLKSYMKSQFWNDTVQLTWIYHPQIGGALRTQNFISLVCVESSSEWRTPHNGFVPSTSDGLPQNLHWFRDVVFEIFRVRMTSFYLAKLYSLSFDRFYVCQCWSYKQNSKRELDCFFLGCS
jgi:hypothetical protein